ncbi:MAG: FAD-binding oxidoreductase [Desulfobacterales bacterium]|nr:FAD-binding oxidoreductase [Desulfobacterales bacterium]
MSDAAEMMNQRDEGHGTTPDKERTGPGKKSRDRAPFDEMTPEGREAFIEGLREIVGERWVATDPCILDTYAWQMNAELIGDATHFMPRAIAVVLPDATREVSAIMKHCHRHGIQCKPMGSGQGPWNAPRRENNSVQVDLRRMDRLIKIDVKNMYAVVETYVTNNVLQTEALKHGLNCHIIGAGGQASQLAAATSFNGHGPDGLVYGFAGRNLLGFEWVTPDGEIVQVGSFDSSGEMFSGDGPGPSVRGIIRGFAGAMGGLGIFTRAAVKLYPWDGPKEITMDGMVPNQMTKIPEHHIVGALGVKGWKEMADLGYALGEADIANYALRNAPNLTIPVLYTTGAEAIKGLGVPLFQAFNHNLYTLYTALHEDEYRYKQKAISEIVKSVKGGFLGSDGGLAGLMNKLRFLNVYRKRIGVLNMIKSIPGMMNLIAKEIKNHGISVLKTGNPLDALLYGKFIRADTNVRCTILLGGNFSTSLGAISPWDMAVRSAQVGVAIKKRYIERGEIVDDDGDGGHGGLYESGSFSHIETVALYDPNDPRHVAGQARFVMETNEASIKKNLGISINSFGPEGSAAFSPAAMDYDKLIQKVKKEYDPSNTADAGWYTDPDHETPPGDKRLREDVLKNELPFDHLEKSDQLQDPVIPESWMRKREYHLL